MVFTEGMILIRFGMIWSYDDIKEPSLLLTKVELNSHNQQNVFTASYFYASINRLCST